MDAPGSSLLGDNFDGSDDTAVFPSISGAIRWIACGKEPLIEKAKEGGPCSPRKLAMAEHVQVLVTGSLHLVGGVMKFLGPGIVELV